MGKTKNLKNEISNMIDPDIEDVVTTTLSGKVGNKRDKYYLFRILGIPPRIAAKACNYNEDYGYKLDRKFREDLNLRARIQQITGSIPEQYKSLCKLRLADIAEIEGKALAEYKEDPKLAISKPQLIKQLKQGAGVLADDEIKPSPIVNIKELRNLMLLVGNRECSIPQLKREKPKDMLED